MDDYSITIYGKTLDKSNYTIDLDNKTFSTEEGNLVLDFKGLPEWTFKTGRNCTFYCSYNCTFNTAYGCTFNTLHTCKFKTGSYCIFKTSSSCTFNTGNECTFNTSTNCTFDTGELCTFLLWHINTCKFKSHDDISIILDRNDRKHYILTKELIDILKVTNG